MLLAQGRKNRMVSGMPSHNCCRPLGAINCKDLKSTTAAPITPKREIDKSHVHIVSPASITACTVSVLPWVNYHITLHHTPEHGSLSLDKEKVYLFYEDSHVVDNYGWRLRFFEPFSS